MEAFHHGMRSKPCFVCETVAGGKNELPQHFVCEDDTAIAFLEASPRAYTYTLVAPKEHREQVRWDFTLEEYLDLQRLIYRVYEAVREEVGAERMYLYTFASNQGGAHVHWHVVSWPPGVPYEDQQGPWASSSKGVLKSLQEETASLAARIGARM
jgi:diadenosine tetraphosphate (Ap4A) HIT family hydrolase